MRVTVVRPGDLGPSEASLWATFQRSSLATLNPFLSLTFARVVGRCRPAARVAVVEADRQIEAFLPFELTTHRMGMPIGYPMNDLQGFVGRGRPIDAWRILEELTTEPGDDCRALLSVLSAGERTVALFFGLIAHGGLSSWFPTYDRELSRFSPGRMMWQPLAEQAASRGITRLDLGYGQDPYKFGLANASYLVAGGAVWASRCEQAVRSVYRRLHERGSRAPGLAGRADGERDDMAELAETAW